MALITKQVEIDGKKIFIQVQGNVEDNNLSKEERRKKQNREKQNRHRKSPQGKRKQKIKRMFERADKYDAVHSPLLEEMEVEMNKFFGGRCAITGVLLQEGAKDPVKEYTVEHIIALNNGGDDAIWNFLPLSRSVNSSKKDRTDLETWYKNQVIYDEKVWQKILDWQEYAWNKWGHLRPQAVEELKERIRIKIERLTKRLAELE